MASCERLWLVFAYYDRLKVFLKTSAQLCTINTSYEPLSTVMISYDKLLHLKTNYDQSLPIMTTRQIQRNPVISAIFLYQMYSKGHAS